MPCLFGQKTCIACIKYLTLLVSHKNVLDNLNIFIPEKKKEEGKEEKMDVDDESKDSGKEKTDKEKEEKSKEEKEKDTKEGKDEKDKDTKEGEEAEKKKKEPEPNFQMLANPARVMRSQLKVNISRACYSTV